MIFYTITSTTLIFAGERTFDEDYFWGLMMMFGLASLLTLKKTDSKSAGVCINRDQTEEWKGWMQLLFLSYHYFHAAPVYNLIRILIAAYVWMTGFGHFTYFLKTGNYDVVRVVRTLMRLNFLVFFSCWASGNELMMYYICPMHTFYFLMVYVFMYIGNKHNKKRSVILIKLALCFIFVTVLFETDVAKAIFFFPARPILKWEYDTDNEDKMHEWYFRAGLDHYASWTGMVCAYFMPNYQSFLENLESGPKATEWLVKIMISSFLIVVNWIFFTTIYMKEKYEYNADHPYYSMITVVSFLWFRNLTPKLRTYYLSMWAWWGKVTLESYISQFHILLTANAKQTILVLADKPVQSMVWMSMFFGLCSKMLFDSTVYFTATMAPNSSTITMVRNFVVSALALGSIFVVAALIHNFTAIPT